MSAITAWGDAPSDIMESIKEASEKLWEDYWANPPQKKASGVACPVCKGESMFQTCAFPPTLYCEDCDKVTLWMEMPSDE